ncbi:MAG: hypothetical protein U9R08_05205 [Nanoarchaeota archaeon]|nr:hypothetical protein [Nanoarchaeota archaeon]
MNLKISTLIVIFLLICIGFQVSADPPDPNAPSTAYEGIRTDDPFGDLGNLQDGQQGSVTATETSSTTETINGVSQASVKENSQIDVDENGNMEFSNLDEATTTTGIQVNNGENIQINKDGTIENAANVNMITGPESLGESFQLDLAKDLSLKKINNEFILESLQGNGARIGQTFIAGYANLLANLNQRTISVGRSTSIDDRGSPDRALSFTETSAVLFNNGEIALRQIDGTEARTDSNGKLKYLKTSSIADDNVMIIPGATTAIRLENIDNMVGVEIDFQGSQTKLKLGKDIRGNINNLIQFRTLDFDAIVNSYKIGKKITVITSNTELDFTTFNFVENLITKGNSKIVYNEEDGIEYLEAAKGSKYTYTDRNKAARSFSIKFNQDFKLRVRKSVTEPDYIDVDGFIDLIEKKIVIKGKAEYSKDTDLYISEDPNTITTIELDNDFNTIKRFTIEAESLTEHTITNAGQFTIKENNQGRHVQVEPLFSSSENIIQVYTTNLLPTTPAVEFINNILYQENTRIFGYNSPSINQELEELTTEPFERYLE